MNKFIDIISKNLKQKSDNLEKTLLGFINSKDSNTINKLTSKKTFQKVECYNINENKKPESNLGTGINYKININMDFKIISDEDINRKIRLNKIQMSILHNYITVTMKEYHKGHIYIPKEDMKKYDDIFEFLLLQIHKDKSDFIRKDIIDFIVKDMSRSYSKNGYIDPDIKKRFVFVDEDDLFD
jgi:hypothetical protein